MKYTMSGDSIASGFGQSAKDVVILSTPGSMLVDNAFQPGKLWTLVQLLCGRGLLEVCAHRIGVVASDTAWMEMEIHLGMSLEEANSYGWRGTNQGHILKTTEFWYNSGNGIDSLGFAAAPGGYRHYS